MLTAFVPAQRHFSVTVVRDYEDRVTILPITEDVYITGEIKEYSIALTPDESRMGSRVEANRLLKLWIIFLEQWFFRFKS